MDNTANVEKISATEILSEIFLCEPKFPYTQENLTKLENNVGDIISKKLLANHGIVLPAKIKPIFEFNEQLRELKFVDVVVVL